MILAKQKAKKCIDDAKAKAKVSVEAAKVKGAIAVEKAKIKAKKIIDGSKSKKGGTSSGHKWVKDRHGNYIFTDVELDEAAWKISAPLAEANQPLDMIDEAVAKMSIDHCKTLYKSRYIQGFAIMYSPLFRTIIAQSVQDVFRNKIIKNAVEKRIELLLGEEGFNSLKNETSEETLMQYASNAWDPNVVK